MRRVLLVLVVLWCVSLSPSARAQTPDASNLDAYAGAITGGTRQLGLGGAYVALADEARGISSNPAAAAYRLPHVRSIWGYDLAIDFSAGTWLDHTRFFNTSERSAEALRQESIVFGSVAASFKYEHFGIGFAAEGRRQAMRATAGSAGFVPERLDTNFGLIHAVVGYGFWDGELIVGAGPRLAGFSFNPSGGGARLLSVSGVGQQAGLLYMPHDKNLRFGVTAKSTVSSNPILSEEEVSDVWVPEQVHLPWEGAVGVAYQFGPRPMNLRHTNLQEYEQQRKASLVRRAQGRATRLAAAKAHYLADPSAETRREYDRVRGEVERGEARDRRQHREDMRRAEQRLKDRYTSLPRQYLLLSTELAIVGSRSDSLGVGSVFQDAAESIEQFTGDQVSYSPRLGVESEVIADWLKLRAGAYLEPARLRNVDPRAHGTFGLDVKLFHWNLFGLLSEFDGWRLSAAADVATGYLNTSFGLGFWY